MQELRGPVGLGEGHHLERQKSKPRGHCLQCQQAWMSSVDRKGTSRSFDYLKSKEEHFRGPMEIVLEEGQWRKGEETRPVRRDMLNLLTSCSLVL